MLRGFLLRGPSRGRSALLNCVNNRQVEANNAASVVMICSLVMVIWIEINNSLRIGLKSGKRGSITENPKELIWQVDKDRYLGGVSVSCDLVSAERLFRQLWQC